MKQPLASFQISTSFQNLLDTVFHSIPKILVFLLILVIGWIVAKVLARIVDMVLRRVRFDRFVERGVVGQALARSNTDATALIARIVYYALLLVTLQMAFGVWGPNPISQMLNAVVAWLPKAVVAIIIIVIASAIARVVKDLINGAIGGLPTARSWPARRRSSSSRSAPSPRSTRWASHSGAPSRSCSRSCLPPARHRHRRRRRPGRPMQERWERMLSAAQRETNSQLAAYQQGRTDAMRAPRPGRPAEPVEQPSYPGGKAATPRAPGVPGPGAPAAPGPGTGATPGPSHR